MCSPARHPVNPVPFFAWNVACSNRERLGQHWSEERLVWQTAHQLQQINEPIPSVDLNFLFEYFNSLNLTIRQVLVPQTLSLNSFKNLKWNIEYSSGETMLCQEVPATFKSNRCAVYPNLPSNPRKS
jgi:hypothetical protein